VRLLVENRYCSLLDLPPQFEVIPGDICDKEAVSRSLEGVSTVFHLAGSVFPRRIRTLYQVNYQGTKTLVDACIEKGIRRILYMSTDSIFGKGQPGERIFTDDGPQRPYRHYDQSKWLAEKYILDKSREGQIDGTALRGFWFFGPFAPPRQQKFLNMMKWPRQLIFGHGRNYRSISHVANVTHAFFLAEDSVKTYGKWYWIAENKYYSTEDIYGLLCASLGTKFKPVFLPGIINHFMRWSDLALGALGYLHPTIHSMGKFNFDIAGNIDKAKKDFGYFPLVTLENNPNAYINRTHPP
jgi:nucleoside-diphosphate-sugar epimerase